MGQVLRMVPRRRDRVKWSAVRQGNNYIITLEWRTKDKALCATQCMSVTEWLQVADRQYYFWTLIEHLRELAIDHGARF